MKKPIYLDYAAATPMDDSVLAAMQPYFSNHFHNPSATYLAGRQAKSALDTARASIAGSLGAKISEIIFAAGATEANNLAIQGVMKRHPKGEVLTSAIEHDSVIQPATLFGNRTVPVLVSGLIDIPKLQKMIGSQTVLISVMLVNNELGTVQPLREIATLVQEARKVRQKEGNKNPLYLHTDAAQAGNYLDLHISRLGVDMLSLNGGKIYGPKQTGGLFIKAGTKLSPLILGGGQEAGLRSGTENISGAVGLAKALELSQARRKTDTQRIGNLKKLFATLLQKNIKPSVINGSQKYAAAHLLSVTLPGHDNERIMMALDEAGVQCAIGSACSASSRNSSHVLKAIGLSEELARSTLRFSLGRDSTEKDINYTVEKLASITAKL